MAVNGRQKRSRERGTGERARAEAKEDEILGSPSRSAELLWGERERPSRGPKPGLSVERIARAAIGIADAEGLSAASMQRVASEFGFTTMALYRYVPGKAELIELMIDMAIGEPPALECVSGGWRHKLEAWARHLWAVFLRHPWALGATGHPRFMGPNELGWLNSALDALSGTGLSGGERLEAFLVVLGHVRTAAHHAVDRRLRQQGGIPGEPWGAVMTELVQKHGDRYPAVREAMSSGAFGPPADDGLEFGLRCVLDGIGVLIAERAARCAG
ncbi:TetR/AcrR family transcriptional regulator C-terminal domain-containing protein [Sorangium sp. So ce119]|uniref:TetR/AcrR family transcriptional regulator n=1 Tax=Sorangium sp. So ce119 TaxID=3133279 RepID=UPI003F5F52C2